MARHQGDGKGILPVWIIDEAQNLPLEFFRDLPAFLNFAFDSRDLMSIWLIGHPRLAQTLERAPYTALHGRIQVHLQLKPITHRERFKNLIEHAFHQAGAQHNPAVGLRPRAVAPSLPGAAAPAGRILNTAMRLTVPKGLNHLPDELIQQAIEESI